MKGKKIENPIRDGLPAKVYLAAFFKPISGYEIARRIFGTRKVRREGWDKEVTKEIITPNKPYAIVKKYKGIFDRIKEKEGNREVLKILSKIEPLLDEIDLELEKGSKAKLTVKEREILNQFIEGKFRKYVAQNFQVDYGQTIDAFAWLTGHLGFPAAWAQFFQDVKNPVSVVVELQKFTGGNFPLDKETFQALLEMQPELLTKIMQSSSRGNEIADFMGPLFKALKDKGPFRNLLKQF
jgi:hypothetical protein